MTTPTMTPSGWYPDPSRRHEFRYWDGTHWSPQVSDRGLATTDPELRPATGSEGAAMVVPPAAPAPAPMYSPPAAPAPAPRYSPPAAPAPAPRYSPQAAPAPAFVAPARAGRRGWIVALVAGIAVLAVIAGLVVWGVSKRGPSAAEVYQQMRTSAAAAKSVHIKGSFIDNGKKLQLDIAGDRAGTNSKVIANDGTDTVEVLTVNGSYYFKADAAFWNKNGGAAVAKLTAGKYVKVPAAAATGMGNLKVGSLLDQIFATNISAVQNLTTNVDKTEVAGVPAYLLTDKIGSNGGKIYTTADGRARLLRLEGPKGSMNFTQWDAVSPMSPPTADQIANVPGL